MRHHHKAAQLAAAALTPKKLLEQAIQNINTLKAVWRKIHIAGIILGAALAAMTSALVAPHIFTTLMAIIPSLAQSISISTVAAVALAYLAYMLPTIVRKYFGISQTMKQGLLLIPEDGLLEGWLDRLGNCLGAKGKHTTMVAMVLTAAGMVLLSIYGGKATLLLKTFMPSLAANLTTTILAFTALFIVTLTLCAITGKIIAKFKPAEAAEGRALDTAQRYAFAISGSSQMASEITWLNTRNPPGGQPTKDDKLSLYRLQALRAQAIIAQAQGKDKTEQYASNQPGNYIAHLESCIQGVSSGNIVQQYSATYTAQENTHKNSTITEIKTANVVVKKALAMAQTVGLTPAFTLPTSGTL